MDSWKYMALRNSRPVPRVQVGLVLAENAAGRFRLLEPAAQPPQEGVTLLSAAEDITNLYKLGSLTKGSFRAALTFLGIIWMRVMQGNLEVSEKRKYRINPMRPNQRQTSNTAIESG